MSVALQHLLPLACCPKLVKSVCTTVYALCPLRFLAQLYWQIFFLPSWGFFVCSFVLFSDAFQTSACIGIIYGACENTISYWVYLGWSLIFSISSKLLDDSHVASLWATLQNNGILNDSRWTYILTGLSNEILRWFFTLTLQGRKCRRDFSLHMRRATEYLCPTQEVISNKWKGKSNIYWAAAVCYALKVSV